jgi:hypothetical protein
MIDPNKQKFNDDLLVGPGDLALAAGRFPTIEHVLGHRELRELFLSYDKPANAAKKQGRMAGFLAIALVYAALALAATEYVARSHHEGSSLWWKVVFFAREAVPFVSAAMGIAGVVIGGMGILTARRKASWLQGRLMTERLRQFHFQSFVLRSREIAASLADEQARVQFLKKRNTWFEGFKGRFVDRLAGELTRTIGEEAEEDAWLHATPGEPDAVDNPLLEPLFDAYRELRIEHQLSYCNYKLREDARLLSDAPQHQTIILSNTGLICIVLLFFIHVLVLCWALFSPKTWPLASVAVNLCVTWIAFAALAVRSVEQGLQPEREIERYQQYRSGVRAVLQRFNQAKSQTEKLRVMREMERLTYDEMQNFLATNARARFVM